MRAEDIKDRDSLLAWLKDRPREDSVWIAYRAAMRVLPILGSLRSSINPGVPILELLRKNLTQEVVCRSALGVRLAIHQSMMDSNLLSYDYVAGAAFSSTSASNTNDLTFLPSKFASDAVDSAGIAAADGSALLIRQRGLDAEYKSSVMRKSHSEIWRETQNDAKLILAWPTSSILQELSRTPLWSSGQPDWPLIYLDNKALHWHAAGYFPFWLRWYKAVLAGTPLNWSLLSEIALIPDEDWEKGIGHIAGVIAGIEAGYAPSSDVSPEVDTLVAALPVATPQKIQITRQTINANRHDLPPTFDALDGYIVLEVARLQSLNYVSDDHRDECVRQIQVLLTINSVVNRLRDVVALPQIADEQAQQVEKLGRVYVRLFQDWPRSNAPDLVDSTSRFALVGASTVMLTMIGVPAAAAVGVGAAMFGTKKLVDGVKAAKEAMSPPKSP